jgi:hypothetical protein
LWKKMWKSLGFRRVCRTGARFEAVSAAAKALKALILLAIPAIGARRCRALLGLPGAKVLETAA